MNITDFIDLTSLQDDKTDCLQRLVDLSLQDADHIPAAICTWPDHIKQLNNMLYGVERTEDFNLPLTAAVLNFPSGNEDLLHVHNDCVFLTEEEYVDEIDYVFDWRAWQSGRKEDSLSKLRDIGDLFSFRSNIKVIVESGAFVDDLETLREMCRAILDLNGPSAFLKTSTGKHAFGATPSTARVVMEEVYRHNKSKTGSNQGHTFQEFKVPCGIKISGGVRTVKDAKMYLNMASEVFGEQWVTSENFRIGASTLFENVLNLKTGSSYSY